MIFFFLFITKYPLIYNGLLELMEWSLNKGQEKYTMQTEVKKVSKIGHFIQGKQLCKS